MACTTEYLEQQLVDRREFRIQRPGTLRRFWLMWKAWYERAQQRRQLAALSDYALKDIALSRADALREAAKPFWLE